MSPYVLQSGALRVDVVSVGASIQRILVPGRDGHVSDVVLGLENGDEYESNPYFFGCVVGRVANRISKGRFSLNGREYDLETNNGPNHLHGGSDGLHRKRWTATEVSNTAVTFVYLSPDGDAGYPGSVAFSVKYELSGDSQLCVTMRGRVLGDLLTPINLAQHTYFNLAGHASGRDVLGHELKLDADTFLELDASQIPTGVRQSVGDPACMDFRRGKTIGAGIEDVPGGMGYDHNYCFSVDDDAGEVREVREVAELRDPQSGRIMVVSTDAPGAQLYTAGYLDGSLAGKDNCRYEKYGGVCIETQALPDSINREEFLKGGSNVVYGPADEYRHVVIYTFTTDRSVPSQV